MMRKLDIDFQNSGGKPSHAGTAVLVLAVIVAAAMLLIQRSLNDQLDLMEATHTSTAAHDKSSAGSQQDDDPALQIAFNQLMLPWGGVFAAVEAAANDQVLLRSLDGNGRNRVIKITAQAPHAVAMLDYLQALKESGKLTGLQLLSHREDDKGALNFVIQADFPVGL